MNPSSGQFASCGAIDLLTVASPYPTSLTSDATNLKGCYEGAMWTPQMFHIQLQPHQALEIGVLSKTDKYFDTIHAALWGNNVSCPTEFREDGGNFCKNDPDIGNVNMTNSGSTVRDLWFAVGGASSLDTTKGGANTAFVLGWRLLGDVDVGGDGDASTSSAITTSAISISSCVICFVCLPQFTPPHTHTPHTRTHALFPSLILLCSQVKTTDLFILVCTGG